MSFWSENKYIRELLPDLCRPGQIFKYHSDNGLSMLLSHIAPSIVPDACFDKDQAEETLKKNRAGQRLVLLDPCR